MTKVMIIDEPMVGLDPKSAKIVRETLKQKSREGIVVFMSTHSLPVAEELCDRIGIIHRGTLIAMGAIEDLRQKAQVREGDLEEVFMILTEGESV